MPGACRRVGAAAVSLLALASCTPSPDGAGAPGPTGSGAEVGGSIVVLAAASLTESFAALGETFETEHPGARVRFSFAASSELASQIAAGAPADVFASASPATMAQVVEGGDAAGDPAVFARNSLEIAVPAGNPAGVTGLADLARPALTVALCAPEVPCGAASAEVFDLAGLTPAPDTLESDVKAALSKVRLGEVDAALVYRTDVQAAGDEVEGLEFPESARAVSDYPVTVLAGSENPATARAFVDLVRSPAGAAVLSAAGFVVP